MTTYIPRPVSETASRPASTAATASRANWAVNSQALLETQPSLAAILHPVIPEARALFARDGSLTFVDDSGLWWQGCSVPQRSAETMLASLDVKGRVACLLAPTLAAHVRVVLRRSRPDQGFIVISPSLRDLAILLRAEDFSEDLRTHRLWFAWGEDWITELRTLLTEQPGLATPVQFVRLPITPNDDVERMVFAAQTVFAETNSTRAAEIERRRLTWRRHDRAIPNLCMIAPSQFRLWDDAGVVLADSLGQATGTLPGTLLIPFDPDDPARSSALALAETASACDAIVSADMSRGDLPGVVPSNMPWITWVTRSHSIPAFAAAGDLDALVVCDESLLDAARADGWPDKRMALGRWPSHPHHSESPAAPRLAIVADTVLVEMPDSLSEFSSHALLWSSIAAELEADPFAIGSSPTDFLEGRMIRDGVGAEGFDAGLFLDRLILPAYAQGIARVLIGEGLPTRLFGGGWGAIEEFQPHADGPLTSRHNLAAVRLAATVVVDVSTNIHRHPVHRIGLPVLHPAVTHNRRGLVGAARTMLHGRSNVSPACPTVGLDLFLRLLCA